MNLMLIKIARFHALNELNTLKR